MLSIPLPSIAGGLRTVSLAPIYGEAPHPLLAPFHEAHPPYRPTDHANALNLYHPMVAAFAPPFCAARGPRLVLATFLQGGVDVAVGAVALGCALLCGLMNQKELAGAYLSEHSINLMQLYVVTVLGFAFGASLIGPLAMLA